LQTILSFNRNEIKNQTHLENFQNGDMFWIDLINPTESEMHDLSMRFNLDKAALQTYFNKSKKPEIRVLENHTFTVILDMKNKDPETLETEAIYLFLGKQWLITIHSSKVILKEIGNKLLTVKNTKIKEGTINSFYYNLIAEIISKYEQLLTAIELSVNKYQHRSFAKPTEMVFEHIDALSRQVIIIRRQFWRVRNIINFLVHNGENKEVKYIEAVYDDISQLIDFVESYEGTINSIRELYIAKVSLQINDTMRILTVFTVVLLPLTLIAGVYGMNGLDLNNLYSLPSGFILITIIMIVIAVGLVLLFVKKQWLMSKDNNTRSKEPRIQNDIHSLILNYFYLQLPPLRYEYNTTWVPDANECSLQSILD
jgi:magnesium transporter